jgi:hypothetical protein
VPTKKSPTVNSATSAPKARSRPVRFSDEPAQVTTASFAVAAAASFIATGAMAPAHSESPSQTKASTSISAQMADMVIGLIADSRRRPDRIAVDTYAAALHWRKTPPETNTLLNANVGYAGKVATQTLILLGDGTNDSFGVSIRDGFRVDEAIGELRHTYKLKKQDSEDSDGGRVDSYILVEGTTEVGVVSLTYGIAKSIRGAGTIDFISMDRLRTDLASQQRKP